MPAKGLLGAIAAVVLVFALGACGADGSSISTADSGPAKDFMAKGGENKYAEFGQEASAAEREAASKVLEENLNAREAGDWAKQCASLAPEGIKEVESQASSSGVESGCVPRLKALAEPMLRTAAVRANTMSGPIAALRVEGKKGYALYHGTHGKDYAMTMEKINGNWMVDALLTIEIP